MGNRDSVTTILSARGVVKTYRRRGWIAPGVEVAALRGINLEVRARSTLAIIGESGAGKSTLARCLAGIDRPDAGRILFRGEEFRNARDTSRHIQMIFQDPGASLNPRFTVTEALLEPSVIHHDGGANVAELLERVELPASCARLRTSGLSGGQKARLALARALAALDVAREGVLILDESLASLDVSIQAQMINLLVDLQWEHRLTYIFVAHDLRLAGHMADEVAVMCAGEIVERGAPHQVFGSPAHPHTKHLINAFTLMPDCGNA